MHSLLHYPIVGHYFVTVQSEHDTCFCQHPEHLDSARSIVRLVEYLVYNSGIDIEEA